jgi:hypothetical protein
LLPVSILVLGAGLLFSGATALVERARAGVVAPGEPGLAQDEISAVAGVHLLVGPGCLVLGILGLLGGAPILLTVIATLSIGASLLLSGAVLGARMAATARHAT